jgi:hypothetical protein
MRVDRFHLLAVGGLFGLIDQWKAMRLPLVCPSCFERALEATLTQGQRLIIEKILHCQACGTTHDIAGWRLAADYQKRGDSLPFLAKN